MTPAIPSPAHARPMPSRPAWRLMSTHQKEAALRAAATPSELKLKDLLSSDARLATRFKFQAAVPGCSGIFADFLFTKEKLVVELDGACHSSLKAKQADWRRTRRMMVKGWRVLRFWNGALRDESEVMRRIWLALNPDVAVQGEVVTPLGKSVATLDIDQVEITIGTRARRNRGDRGGMAQR